MSKKRSASTALLDEPPRRVSFRDREMTWISDHAKELAAHRGKWVVVEGARIQASDPVYQTARDQALRAGIDCPLIFFVPDDEADGFIGL